METLMACDLSILIPSIPERIPKLSLLLSRLEGQIGDRREVEVISFMDNCRRSIGHKRNAMVAQAQGRFITHLDDDDIALEGYVSQLVSAITVHPDVDVIHFDSICKLNGDAPFKVTTDVGLKVSSKEQISQAGKTDGKWRDIVRPPWHWCCWRRDFARRFDFPDGTMDEDWYWLRQALPCIEHSHRIDEILHGYVWSQEETRSNVGKPTT